MESTVQNNHVAIHSYREEINQRIDELQTQLRRTEDALKECNDAGWKDVKFKEFKENFEQDKVEIQDLCKALEEYYSNILAGLEDKLINYADMPLCLSQN